VGLEAIILYKLGKAVVQAGFGVACVVLLVRGAEAAAATWAEKLLEWSPHHWALRAATLLVRSATTKHVKIVAGLAFGDAVMSAVEGLALRAGKWWAPWLVVVATASFLPWEAVEIVRHANWMRVALLVVNTAVVVYLLRTAGREHRELEAQAHPAAVDTPSRGS
jgi:uncharacterized membrane protein (DUF2068 family)